MELVKLVTVYNVLVDYQESKCIRSVDIPHWLREPTKVLMEQTTKGRRVASATVLLAPSPLSEARTEVKSLTPNPFNGLEGFFW